MKVFRNEKLNKDLIDNGYVVISLLNLSEIETLNSFFINSPDSYQEIFTTYAINDYEYKRDVDRIIKEVVHSNAKSFFTTDYIPFWGNFMMKLSDENSNLKLHADWQYVDEKKSISLNLWCPLIDTNLKNGALHVIPKSHKWVEFPRGINLPRYYVKNELILKKHFGKKLLLKKGEAVIYDHRLLHYSLPNRSQKNRLAISLSYIPKNTIISVYYNSIEKDDKTAELFEIVSSNALLKSNFYESMRSFKTCKKVEIPALKEIDLVQIAKEKNLFNHFKRLFYAKA